MNFAETLLHTRLRAGLTQEELSSLSDVSCRTIGTLERLPLSVPRLSTARRLAAGLGLVGEERERFLAVAIQAVCEVRLAKRDRHARPSDFA